jgi:hypothetical protein
MKNRGICPGSLVFLGTIISLLAGCDLGVTPEDGPAPLTDKNGNYIIKVNTAMAPRSIAAADAALYAEEYEIVCHDGSNFYTGYTKNGNLTVSLPEGVYDMLVLAGNGSRVLLGSGWLGGHTIGPETGSVTITVKPLTILDSEMDFNDGATNAPPSGIPPTYGPVAAGSVGLTTTFKIHNMDALENAAATMSIADIFASNGAAGFAAASVALKFYDTAHIGIIKSATLASGSSASSLSTLVFNPLTYTAGENWAALVYLNLEYIPFSESSAPSGAHKWQILNGLGKNASNGAVKVTAGSGWQVSVDINTDFN